MSSFVIKGGKPLSGVIQPQGAKNEALQILCATLLTQEEVVISNIPLIKDVLVLIDLLKKIGVKIKEIDKHTYSFVADTLDLNYLNSDEYQELGSKIRGSVLFIGPLLARLGACTIPQPGGDKIGRRRIDVHLEGFLNMGAKVDFDTQKNQYILSSQNKKLQGKYHMLKEASVTGTGNIIMGSVLAEGKTTIYNAACEPYIQQLCCMLNSMGAKIKGIGSNLLEIYGVKDLGGTTHKIDPDMIEIGSWVGLAAMTSSDILVRGIDEKKLGILPKAFQSLGIQLEFTPDGLHIPSQKSYTIPDSIDRSFPTISDAPWPGLSPDLISILLVSAIKAKGSVLIHQKMFESRLFFTDSLIDMGAKILLCDPHRAVVIGLGDEFKLKGSRMNSPDIRAGISLLIAALAAEGESTIHNIEQIDRGYESIDSRLQNIGASITRYI